MILNGTGVTLILGTPCGKQFASDSSPACTPVMRSLVSAAAQGCIGTSPGFRSAARFCKYFGPGAIQIPDRSAFPSGLRGAGAVRFGLPSLVRGIVLSGSFNHCAGNGDSAADKNTQLTILIFESIGAIICQN